jgi:branched-chain amino acid transport system permease protein
MSLAYLTHIAVMFAIHAILIGSFSFLLGGVGVFNLAHIATAAVGAYASALVVLKLGWSFGAGLAVALVMGVIFGLALALVLRKVRGDYLALIALGVHLLTVVVLLNWPSLTRGALGLPGIPRPETFSDPVGYLVLSGLIALVVVAVYATILRSPYGRAMAAVRDDEVAAAALGKDVGTLRMTAYLLASAGAALGGALLAHYIQFIDPLSFPVHLLALIIAGAILGGVGSMRGAIAGTAIVVIIPELLRQFALAPDVIGPLRQMVFAMLILFVLLARPRGLFGVIDVR